MTAIIILAAGRSSRLGRPKQLLTFQDESLLRRSARTALESGCGPVTVVLGFSAQRMVSELDGLPVQIVINRRWEEGMASSLRTGLRAVSKEVSSVLLMLCDQPHVDAELLRSLHGRFEEGALIVTCRYRGVIGVPVLFSRKYFGDLLTLEGDQGARSVIQEHRQAVEVIDFEAAAVDIDTEDEYAQLLEDS